MMKRFLTILALCLSGIASSSAFTVTTSVAHRRCTPPSTLARSSAHPSLLLSKPPMSSSSTTATRLNMIFGPKDDGSPGDYVCKDCGYVFTKGPQAWAALPNDYSCPPCGAAKWRFTKVPKGNANKAKGGAKPGAASAAPAKKGLFG